ncbi:Uma2 family endonuclease [Microcoleus sp. herbarium12]|jgi:Uma2 family endonuclease|uniref:Uma2 family endonuclease n=1 Tax=Microcoleus sp. herbarium12 TaxID=3055437 RepID=UPI002FD5D4D6
MTAVAAKRFTIAEYHRLGELGFFEPHDRVELIRGEIVLLPQNTTFHSDCYANLVDSLVILLGDRAIVRGQQPIILYGESETVPDAVVARNRADDYLAAPPEPADILLVVEIADATLSYAQREKLSVYAEDGISDYWILNLVDNCLEIYHDPYQDNQGRFGYRLKRIVLPHETVGMLCFPDFCLDLAKIFSAHDDV